MRLKIQITGLVQGVGFRPYVYRLAKDMGLNGFVLNNAAGVWIEAEGEKRTLDAFLIRVEKEKPGISHIYSLQHIFLEDWGYPDFEIKKSDERRKERRATSDERRTTRDARVPILPDIAACEDCLNDIDSPENRRYLYPFTNCTNCGPRFTIIQSLPYDRAHTSMKNFTMCPECEREYHTPSDRRFHAQPDACHECGPSVGLYDRSGTLLCERNDAIEQAAERLRAGNIIALKGIGGYHLLCDATGEEAVKRLRERKQREEKPLAVMFPDMDAVKKEAHISDLEERALASIERPIVIVKKRDEASLAGAVSPDNATVGVFLPYSPLHHILMQKLQTPFIATSANMSDEPIVKDENDAFDRLSEIADYVLSHNRDIVRRCDDSVVRIMAGRQVPIRRSRGFAPLPVALPFKLKKNVLALGPHMNNTIALGIDDTVYLSQHIGDLDTSLAVEFYEETIRDFLRLFDVEPDVVVSDLHAGYYSTKFGERHYGDRLVKVQHHFAHILSCMAENDLPETSRVIGFPFDGTGHGSDGTIWGGEVFIASYREFKRAYHLQPYKLPGGDKAVKEPYRTALSLLYETGGDQTPDYGLFPVPEKEKRFILEMIRKDVHSPRTTSMGRLFDGVASIIGLRHRISYHAQAAILLEQLALKSDDMTCYNIEIRNGVIHQLPVIVQIMDDLKKGIPGENIARRFHNTVVHIIISVSQFVREETGISHVALSGGVFQNAIILEGAYNKLQENGFTPLIHQLTPPNDGCISLGQVVAGHFSSRA